MQCPKARTLFSGTSFNISPPRGTTRMVSGVGRLYTPRPFMRCPFMEPHKIREEVTALQTRFDALRGYL